MDEFDWDNKIDYLRNTRNLYYNDDYLEFLVKSVWKIHEPVHMVDYGCGYGYLGLKLLPLLPKGTTYTGIDKGEQLLRQARDIFRNLPYETDFIHGDLNEIKPEKKYDIAVCHAFLLHMSNPTAVLETMIQSVVHDGRIICFEPHWISGMSSYHLYEHNLSNIIPLGFLQKLFEHDTKRDGKDGNIGIKLPIFLSQLGVEDIQCRVSDKVNFLGPYMNPDSKEKLYDSLKEDGFGETPIERESFMQNLMNRGADLLEAQNQYEAQRLLSSVFTIHSSLTYAPNMKITFGIVKH